MGYYFIDDEDGYIREFDENRKFIPNENVAAFAAGPGFDWSQLKKKERQWDESEVGEARVTRSSARKSSEIPSWVRRAAERYAEDNRKKAIDQGRSEITDKADGLARDAYISYRKEDKLLPKDLAKSGIYSGSGRESSKAYARYMQAMRIIQGNMDSLLEKLEKSAETQEEKDIKDYINRWKQERA